MSRASAHERTQRVNMALDLLKKEISPKEVVSSLEVKFVATTSVSTPVRKVGWMTGANFGLWLTGSSLSRLASLAFA
ncbi:MAG: hypothetical protein JO151_13510 [Verrucomicrobia bacterium]|nr:hypothetical protein [Verrucomicrobiota bacterium]